MSTVVRDILDRIVRLPEEQRAELHLALSRLEEDEWRSALAEARHTARRRGIDDDAIAHAVAALRYGDGGAETMKVLFDTNVYISEALVGGLAERIIDATLQARWRAFVSAYLLDETERVLHEKLGFSARFASLARQQIRRRCEPIATPLSRHKVTADPKDSPILRAAIEAAVDFLVTNDHHLLNMHPYEGIRILSMRDFAAVLRAEGLLPD